VLDVRTALPAAGEHQRHLHETLPRSWRGSRSPRIGICDESNEPSPNRSANAPRAWSPTRGTTPEPPDSTRTRFVALLFTLEVPFWSGLLLSRQLQFPWLEGLFRGRAQVTRTRVGSSAGAVATDRSAGSRPGRRGGIFQHTDPEPADGRPGCPVSRSRPSNRACGFPAHGSPTPFTAGIRSPPPVPEGPGGDNDP
jgi:hypothetical protein